MLIGSTLLELALNISWQMQSSTMPRWPVWVAQALLSLATLTGLHAVAYKVLPDVPVRWTHVWPSALATSFGFVAVKAGLCLYIGHRAFLSVNAALGSMLALMLWLDLYASLFFLGVELTQVLSHRRS